MGRIRKQIHRYRKAFVAGGHISAFCILTAICPGLVKSGKVLSSNNSASLVDHHPMVGIRHRCCPPRWTQRIRACPLPSDSQPSPLRSSPFAIQPTPLLSSTRSRIAMPDSLRHANQIPPTARCHCSMPSTTRYRRQRLDRTRHAESLPDLRLPSLFRISGFDIRICSPATGPAAAFTSHSAG